jgi:hypothetical protein
VRAAGWGIDACLSTHVDGAELNRYLSLVGRSNLGWLREREVGVVTGVVTKPGPWTVDRRPAYRAMKEKGFRVLAFATTPFETAKPQAGDQLPGNLFEVHEQGRFLGRELSDLVDAWEMVCEADVGYCRDLPDRLVAYQKALYLGIKHGARESSTLASGPLRTQTKLSEKEQTTAGNISESQNEASTRSNRSIPPIPLVLMGALALPPGPWLDRALRNDLLSYTDAYNFHFYGHANDLAGVIAAHERIVRLAAPTNVVGTKSPAFQKFPFRAASVPSGLKNGSGGRLPLWITECGVNATVPTDFLNSERRALQAEFTVSTARRALAARSVSMFMPFILVNKNDPHALTLSAAQPLPAWSAFADFMRDNPWPQRSLAEPPVAPNPVVVQWLPDNSTTIPHKVSGTYRFVGDRPIRGAIRIYNFSLDPKIGCLVTTTSGEVHGTGLPSGEFTIPAMEMVAFPIEFTRYRGVGYFRTEWSVAFVELDEKRSRVAFGLEVAPAAGDFVETRLPLAFPAVTAINHPSQPTYSLGEPAGAWQTINGLNLVALPDEGNTTRLRAWVTKVSNDPLRPTTAIAAIDRLPEDGFIRLVLREKVLPSGMLRVDLVDRSGQRFTIWENLGMSYLRPSNDIWLNFKDFGIYFWGRCTENPVFHPENITEIQLRFYLERPNDPLELALSVMRPRSR